VSAAPVGIVACGALARDVANVAAQRDWAVTVVPLPPLLHNHPDQIAAAVDAALTELAPTHPQRFVAYSDCGTYGALDEVLARHGVDRLPGAHCYDVYAGASVIAELLEQEPGTYLLTDYLVRSFHRSVIVELGLDRYPDLHQDYFRHYRRVVWLASNVDEDLHARASQAAEFLGLPLIIREVGTAGLGNALAASLSIAAAAPTSHSD